MVRILMIGIRRFSSPPPQSWLWAFGSVPEFSALDIQSFLSARKSGEPLPPEHPMKRFERGKVEIVDCRTASEFDGGHIEGAINCSVVPPWSLQSRLEELNLPRDENDLVLCICLSAHRSVMAVKLLRENLKYDNVYQLAKGMQAWRALELPEVKTEAKRD